MPLPCFVATDRADGILLALAVTLVALVLWAAAIGAVDVSAESLFGLSGADSLQRTVFLEIRLPRVLLAATVGGGLGIAGALLQGLFRNPLADPGLIGVASGAALGAIGVIAMGVGAALPAPVAPFALQLAAVAGAIVVTSFVYRLAGAGGGRGTATMLLVGIAINALAGVGIGAFQYLADDPALRTLTFWMMGSFGRSTWVTAVPTAAVTIGAGMAALGYARALDRLQLGESEARALGVDVRRTRRGIVLSAAAITGAGVAMAGMIGFIGLVVPHLARLLGGSVHRYVVPASGLLGASLAVAADLWARTVIAPAEIPVGLVTSAIGSPFFLWLVVRARQR